jgi:hypothetical protein
MILMTWLRENAEVLSFGLAALSALIATAFWLAKKSKSDPSMPSINQSGGNNSTNIISSGNVHIGRDLDEK